MKHPLGISSRERYFTKLSMREIKLKICFEFKILLLC